MKPGRDPKYLEWIRTQCCLICHDGPVEAAHVGERGLGQKCPDRETIPLCAEHHRTGDESHHVLGRKFWMHHGMSRDRILLAYQERYADEMEFC
jgi:hypothetical protein